ncbi:MAG: GIN domain-containing protein [Candidatus Promineifilaceae bacterium]|jgi:hypothetical protein
MRSRTFSTILFLGIALTLLTACTALIERAGDLKTVAGSGNVVTETRPVSGFSAVSLRGMGSVIIDQNGSESLQISADDNFLPYLKTEVRGDTLYIEASDDAEGVVFTNVTDLTFRINAAALEAIELAGAGSIEVNDLDTETWRVTVPGAGSITVSGRTAEQTVEMEGAGSYNAENLESQEATIRSSGAGMAVVRVSDKLDVTIEGLGSVQYIGSPVVTQEINGLGSVSQRE